MLDKARLEDIGQKNPQVDAAALRRGIEAARRLAEVGIEVGSYRLEPALGGDMLKGVQSESRAENQRSEVSIRKAEGGSQR